MGGPRPDAKKAMSRSHRQPTGQDNCDLSFRIDLMGVRSAHAAKLRPGDRLHIVLLRDGDLRAVVCQTEQGDRVGAVSAFPGLSRLIECMESGVRYLAVVERSSPQSCGVFVARSSQ